MKAFHVSAVLFFFCLNIFNLNCFLIGAHIDEKQFSHSCLSRLDDRAKKVLRMFVV